VVFQDVLGRSILAGSSAAMPGAGVRMADVQQIFSQGSLANTGISTDLALNGDGFFTVKGTVDGVTANFYTRAGQFVINADGYLVNTNGLEVQGYAGNPDGTFQSAVSSLRAPTSAIQPRATEEMVVTANLDAAAVPPALPWDDQDPANTSNFSTSMTVYDSLGNSHAIDIFFVKTGTNTWDYHVLASGDDLDPPDPGNNVPIGAGDLTFSTNGELDTFNEATAISVDFAGATPAQAIALDFGTDTASGGSGLDGITQFASASSVSSQNQDGYSSGDFAGVAVDGRGVVEGLYTNGQRIPIGQLAIAKFRANDGLSRAGQSLWVETRESGSAALGTAGSGGRGAVSAGTLESSNVDLAEEFIGLIQHQRSFSANSKTITTADEMLQELISIKR
jgi:flagellar hook protein FlgE